MMGARSVRGAFNRAAMWAGGVGREGSASATQRVTLNKHINGRDKVGSAAEARSAHSAMYNRGRRRLAYGAGAGALMMGRGGQGQSSGSSGLMPSSSGGATMDPYGAPPGAGGMY